MERVNIQNLAISISSLRLTTEQFCTYLDSNFWQLVYHSASPDFDYIAYNSHYYGVLSYARSLPANSDTNVIKQKIYELPEINQKEFEAYTWIEIPHVILYSFLFPLGLFLMRKNYIKITNLQNKLGEINSKLGTAEFMLKATLNYK